MPAEGHRRSVIVPGQGVDTIRKLDIKPIKSLLRAGSFSMDVETVNAFSSFEAQDVPAHCVQAVWESDSAKGFRNAYASCLVEEMWSEYIESISGDNEGKLYKMSLMLVADLILPRLRWVIPTLRSVLFYWVFSTK